MKRISVSIGMKVRFKPDMYTNMALYDTLVRSNGYSTPIGGGRMFVEKHIGKLLVVEHVIQERTALNRNKVDVAVKLRTIDNKPVFAGWYFDIHYIMAAGPPIKVQLPSDSDAPVFGEAYDD